MGKRSRDMEEEMGDRSWQVPELGAGVPKAAGAYSPVVRAGDLLFVSGQVPKDPGTGELVGEDVVTQTRAVFGNLRLLLEAAGSSLADVVSVTAYLARIEDWAAFNEEYAKQLEAPYPTRTTLGAGLHGFLVEINAIAYVPH
jgi:2-iminobutanoate/2-iminopropanoate deaminase